MINYKKIFEEALKESNAEMFNEKPAQIEGSEQTAENVTTIENRLETTADDVPTYTATVEQINLWHAQVNHFCQSFLRIYDLDCGTTAYDSFKVGVDKENHAITFAIDDTHYLKIDLDDTNVRPIDKEQAEKVLSKINSMRFEQNKAYPFCRKFDW